MDWFEYLQWRFSEEELQKMMDVSTVLRLFSPLSKQMGEAAIQFLVETKGKTPEHATLIVRAFSLSNLPEDFYAPWWIREDEKLIAFAGYSLCLRYIETQEKVNRTREYRTREEYSIGTNQAITKTWKILAGEEHPFARFIFLV